MGSARKLFNELALTIANDQSIAIGASEAVGSCDRLDHAGEDNAIHDVVAIVELRAATGISDGEGITLVLQHADDNGSGSPGAFSSCTAATEIQVGGPTVTSISGQVSSGVVSVTNSTQATGDLYIFGYLGDKRHLRVLVTNASGTTAYTGGVTVLFAGANPRDMLR